MVLRFFTINDEIVRKAIKSIAKTIKKSSMDSPIIIGGMAVQIYSNQKEYLRPTADIDLLYLPNIPNWGQFKKNIGGRLGKKIKKQYQVQLKKSRNLYEVKIMNGQHNNAKELFFIHFDNLNSRLYEKNKEILKNQAKNAIEIEFKDNKIFITRVEDVLIRKILRMNKKLYNLSNSPLESSISTYCKNNNWKELAKMPIEGWLEKIIQTQNSFSDDLKILPERYVANKDMYNICLLARYIEGTENSFNKAYFFEVKETFEKL